MKKKIILAYSGGLDTSIMLKWLEENYDYELVTFTADVGQNEDLKAAKTKALKLGIKPENIFVCDLKEEFVKDYVFPMFRANAVYEGEYLLGTAIARPLIAKAQVDLAKRLGAVALSHGATGKGNDQVRFELGFMGLGPELKIIAPWREWELNSRESLLEYAKKHGIEIASKKGKSPYSMDANLLHISYEGLELEDPGMAPKPDMWRWCVDVEDAPNEADFIELEFKKGDLVAINGDELSPAKLLARLNELGAKHGIGRIDIVENRLLGMKSRGCYETPGGTILLKAHRAAESLTLDRETVYLKDSLMPKYARLIYDGLWFSKERIMLQALIDKSQEEVNASVTLKLFKGNVSVVKRSSPNSLYSAAHCTFEEDEVYDQSDAAGFIKLKGLRFIIKKEKK